MRAPLLTREQALARAVELASAAARTNTRFLLGLAGAPGIGKSTFAAQLVHGIEATCSVGLVTMDGFHLSHQVLTDRGDVARKGAPDTFDVSGYVHVLHRLRSREEECVWAPEYQRELHNAVAAAVGVERGVPFIVTEGNYLLCTQGQWAAVRPVLDEVWFLDGLEEVRIGQLTDRHVRHGRSRQEALARAVHGVDGHNAALVQASACRADYRVDVTGGLETPGCGDERTAR